MDVKFFIGFVIGVIAEAIVSLIFRYFRSAFGTLKIDNSNSEKEIYRFVVNDLDELSKKKYVELKIERGADLSQE